MKILSRVIGTALALGGIVPFAIVPYVTWTEGWNRIGLILLAMGLGLWLAGRYYLRLDPDAPDEDRIEPRSVNFVLAHRSQLKVLGSIVFGLTLFHLSAAWTVGKRASGAALYLLFIEAIVLVSLCRKVADPQVTDNRDWNNVPTWIRTVLTRIQNVEGVAVFLMLGLITWSQWFDHFDHRVAQHLAYRIVVRGVIDSHVHALAALFLSYGELRPFTERKESAPIP